MARRRAVTCGYLAVLGVALAPCGLARCGQKAHQMVGGQGIITLRAVKPWSRRKNAARARCLGIIFLHCALALLPILVYNRLKKPRSVQLPEANHVNMYIDPR